VTCCCPVPRSGRGALSTGGYEPRRQIGTIARQLAIPMRDGTPEQQELVADFAEHLAMNQARRLLHIVLDEAEDFLPASPVKGPQLRAFHALDTLIRNRRARGIAVSTVASRLANLNNNVTSQAGRFILFSAISPQDLDAVAGLIRYGGSPQGAEQLSGQVARLAQGEAIHLTHGRDYGHARFRVRRLKTFNSHQMAPIGAAEKKPVKLATITSKVLKIARATLFPTKPVVEPSPSP